MQNEPLNIDKTEKEKFDSLADHWWDTNGKLRTLHHINPVRLQYIDKLIHLQGKSILDLGCGGGLLTEAMAEKKAHVTGLDINESAIAVANEHKTMSGLDIEYIATSAEEYALENNNRFDVITCMELLEHVPDINSLLSACSDMLKPGGYLFLATINRSLKSYFTAILAAEHFLRLLPRGTHDYAKFIRPSELNKWLQQNGLELLDISGMSYIPGINKCTITADPSVNYIACARLNGR